MVQAIIDTYGNGQEGQEIMQRIIQNAGPHLKVPVQVNQKVHAGEVAIAFGLRHQAVADKKNEGLPIDYVDPTEGKLYAYGIRSCIG